MAGKRLWEFVDINRVGRPSAFESPEEMWERASVYFKWCEDNPIMRHKIMSSMGEVVCGYEEKQRAMTYAGLFIHMNIGESTWYDYKKKPEFSGVIYAIDRVMFEQKFSGAASGEFNANIIARDLGLADKAEIEQSVTAAVDVKADIGFKEAAEAFKREFGGE